MQRNIYISNLDQPLSHHIAQFFRQDHLEVTPSTRIIGSLSSKATKPEWIYAAIDFEKQANLACRAVVDCDLVILDLRTPSHEAQTIIRFLTQLADTIPQTVRVIGLSSLLTWQGLKGYHTVPIQEDREAMLASVVDQTQWQPLQLQEDDYRKRIPGVFGIKTYQLENMLMGLNTKKNIKASVLGLGMVYGKDNEMIQHELLSALQGKQIDVWGNGNNLVPMVHIDTVLASINILIEHPGKQYAVARDQNVYSQKQVKEFIAKCTGNKATLVNQEQLFLTTQQALWSFQPRICPSAIFNTVIEHDFAIYCQKNILADLCEYTQWKPSQFVLYTEKFQSTLLDTIKNDLSKICTLVTQEQVRSLNRQLVIQNIPESQLDPQTKKGAAKKLSKAELIQQELQNQPPRYSEALSTLLTPLKYLPFALIVPPKLRQHVENYFVNGLTEVVSPQTESDIEKTKLVYGSPEWFECTGLQPKQKSQVDVTESVRDAEKVNEGNIRCSQGKKDQKLVLTTQYLLDNVLTAVSEAKFNIKIKNKTGLRPLIDELKAIWQRGNYQSCFNNTKEQKTPILSSKKTIK